MFWREKFPVTETRNRIFDQETRKKLNVEGQSRGGQTGSHQWRVCSLGIGLDSSTISANFSLHSQQGSTISRSLVHQPLWSNILWIIKFTFLCYSLSKPNSFSRHRRKYRNCFELRRSSAQRTMPASTCSPPTFEMVPGLFLFFLDWKKKVNDRNFWRRSKFWSNEKKNRSIENLYETCEEVLRPKKRNKNNSMTSK